MSLKLAIITPSYNQGLFLERTIKSVLSQNISSLDYVVVDGQSQDDTIKILKQYSRKLRYISEKDRGQSHAVNKGIMMTTSDIVGWLNSDDIYYPNALSVVLDFFEKNPEVDVVYGQANHIDAEDKIVESYPTQQWNPQQLRQTCFISQPAVFFRRRVLERVGLLNEKLHFCMDYEYWLRLAQSGAQFAYLPQVLAGSRVHPQTKTMSQPQVAEAEALTMLKHRLGYVPENWLLNAAISYVKNKTSFSSPQPRYLWAVYLASVKSAFRWNGFLRGLQSVLTMPRVMLQRAK